MSRLLLDANVSPALAEALRWRGHDAVHVNELGLRTASDATIFRRAAESRRAVVTHDDDYLRLLRHDAGGPSVIHLSQRELQRDPVVGRLSQAMRLTEVLHAVGDRLSHGIAVRVGARAVRVDPLPGARQRQPRPVPTGPTTRARTSPVGLDRHRRLPGPGGRER